MKGKGERGEGRTRGVVAVDARDERLDVRGAVCLGQHRLCADLQRGRGEARRLCEIAPSPGLLSSRVLPSPATRLTSHALAQTCNQSRTAIAQRQRVCSKHVRRKRAQRCPKTGPRQVRRGNGLIWLWGTSTRQSCASRAHRRSRSPFCSLLATIPPQSAWSALSRRAEAFPSRKHASHAQSCSSASRLTPRWTPEVKGRHGRAKRCRNRDANGEPDNNGHTGIQHVRRHVQLRMQGQVSSCAAARKGRRSTFSRSTATRATRPRGLQRRIPPPPPPCGQWFAKWPFWPHL